MSQLTGNRVMSGTHGQLWLDNEFVAEVKAFQAKINFNKQEVQFCGQMAVDTKLTSYKGTGSVTMHKVNSRMVIKIEKNMKKGIETRFVMISNLNDPDAYGSERVAIRNISLDDLTLADWKAGELGEVTNPFTYTDYELLDKVVPQ